MNTNLETLKQYITINGGATLDARGNILSLANGYMVSLPNTEKRTSLEALTAKDLRHYLKLAKKKRAFCGLWLDAGILYLDISAKIGDKATARKMGKRYGQIAIYDNANAESIYLK